MSYYIQPFDSAEFRTLKTARGELKGDLVAAHREVLADPRWDGYQVNPNSSNPHTVLFGRPPNEEEKEKIQSGEADAARILFNPGARPDPFIAVGRSGEFYELSTATICDPAGAGEPQLVVAGRSPVSRVKNWRWGHG